MCWLRGRWRLSTKRISKGVTTGWLWGRCLLGRGGKGVRSGRGSPRVCARSRHWCLSCRWTSPRIRSLYSRSWRRCSSRGTPRISAKRICLSRCCYNCTWFYSWLQINDAKLCYTGKLILPGAGAAPPPPHGLKSGGGFWCWGCGWLGPRSENNAEVVFALWERYLNWANHQHCLSGRVAVLAASLGPLRRPWLLTVDSWHLWGILWWPTRHELDPRDALFPFKILKSDQKRSR